MAKGIPAAAPQVPAQPQKIESVQPPAAEEEAPPWVEEPPAPRAVPAQETPAPTPPQPPVSRPVAPPPTQHVEVPAAAPSVAVAAPASLNGFWPDMVHALHGKVPAGEYSFLSNGKMVQGAIDGPILKLWAQNDFVRSMINKPGIVAAVAEQAKLLPGGPYRVTVVVGAAPAAAPVPRTPASTAASAPAAAPPAPAIAEVAAEAMEDDPLDSLLAMGDEFGDIITEED